MPRGMKKTVSPICDILKYNSIVFLCILPPYCSAVAQSVTAMNSNCARLCPWEDTLRRHSHNEAEHLPIAVGEV